MSNERLLMKADEAAQMLCMGRSTFWAHVKAGKLPQPVRIGGITRWKMVEIRRLAEASPTTTPSACAAVAGAQ
jgi:predicted DNA-binding transcriptional regulator AlpA